MHWALTRMRPHARKPHLQSITPTHRHPRNINTHDFTQETHRHATPSSTMYPCSRRAAFNASNGLSSCVSILCFNPITFSNAPDLGRVLPTHDTALFIVTLAGWELHLSNTSIQQKEGEKQGGEVSRSHAMLCARDEEGMLQSHARCSLCDTRKSPCDKGCKTRPLPQHLQALLPLFMSSCCGTPRLEAMCTCGTIGLTRKATSHHVQFTSRLRRHRASLLVPRTPTHGWPSRFLLIEGEKKVLQEQEVALGMQVLLCKQLTLWFRLYAVKVVQWQPKCLILQVLWGVVSEEERPGVHKGLATTFFKNFVLEPERLLNISVDGGETARTCSVTMTTD